MQTFCTIITANYLPFAKVLYQSLQKFLPGTSLQVLVIDENNILSSENLYIHSVESVVNSKVAKGIQEKYAYTNPGKFRWALKPVFISYLLQNGFEKVIYADADLFFVSNYSFLFDELDLNNIILTPHWPNLSTVEIDQSLFGVLKGGLYNAGFIGANKKGQEAIGWWAEICHFKTEENSELGLYFDQKYLNVLPVQFDNVKIIKHQGCNLASWNLQTCKREIIDGKLMINQKFEPVFIHFNRETIVNILGGNDKLLQPHLEEYMQKLKNAGLDLLNDKILDLPNFNLPFIKIKHKLHLRTRLKQFLFKLANKL